MKKNTNTLELSTSLKSELRRLATPIFVDIALVMMLGTVDTMMLSQHSDEAVAAVGVDNQLMSIIFLVYQFISMGSAILCAQYIGAGMRRRLVQVVGISLILNLVIGLAVSAVLWLQAPAILTAMGIRNTLMGDALTYLRITGVCSFVQAVSLAFSASLRSAGKTTYPMVVTLVSNVLNIIGNYILIFGKFGAPALGVEGAAISTAASRAVAMVLLGIFHTRQHISSYPLEWFRPFPWMEFRKLIRVGIPAMSEELSYCLSQLVAIYMINKLGDMALATRTYCWNVLAYCCLFSASFTQGGSILIGHLVGKGKSSAAYTLGNYILRVELMVCVSVAVVLAVCSRWILLCFTDNDTILSLGVWVFCINIISEIGRTRNIFACGSLRAAGDVFYPVVIGIIFQWAIAVGVAYALGIWAGLGLLGIWSAFALDENVRGIILTHRWHTKRWMGKAFT